MNRTLLSFFFVALLIPYGVCATAQQPAPERITLGIFPYVSPAQLVRFHTPLKELVERTLGRPVTLVTAPNFKQFIQRTHEGRYDYIMTAPHLGRLAEVRDGYRPIVHSMHEVQGVYLTHKDSDIYKLEDLAGKTITTVGRAAIITQMAEQQLRELGLIANENISFRFTKTHNNAMYAPLRGESDASITGILLWRKIGDKQRDQVRVIGKTPVAIGFQVMAAARVSLDDQKRLQGALLGFHNTAPGKPYFQTTGLRRFEIVDEQEKAALDPYIRIFLKK